MTSAVAITRLRQLMLAAGVCLVLIGCGYGVTHGYSSRLLALAGVVAVLAVAVAQRGAFLGLMLVAAMNGIPVVDTTHRIASHVTGQDLATVALIAAGIVYPAVDRARSEPKRITRAMFWMGVALLLWWLFTVVRTWMGGQAGLLAAANYGRDFGFFAALLMALPRIRLSRREIQVLLTVVTVAVCLFSAGQIVTVIGLGTPQWLVHAGGDVTAASTVGFSRLYASMNDLLLAGLAAAIGAVLLARDARLRRRAIPIALLLAVSFALELTRARWLGLILALLVVSLRLMLRSDRGVSALLKRRLGALSAALAGAAAVGVVTAPHYLLSGPFVQRFLSFFTDLQSEHSTIATRVQVIGTMSTLLAGKWLLGLGFVPPSAHFFLGLPEGSLRNSDVGVLNSVITMGIVGTVFLYLPVVAVLVHTLRRRAWSLAIPYPWLRYAAAIWIIATVASSASIVTLFSVSGLAMTAVILTLAVHPSVSGTDPDPEPALVLPPEPAFAATYS